MADVTIVGTTARGKNLINSNVAIELGYALHARTDKNVLLVFNKHYGKHEDLPFDLRHKGGAIDFRLDPACNRDEIDAQRKILTGAFARSLQPFLTQPTPHKRGLSLKVNIKHHRTPVPGGGSDERHLLIVNVENDGELEATNFRLDVEIPAFFLDGGGYRLQAQSVRPGFALFQISNGDPAFGRMQLSRGDKTRDVELFHYAIREQTKRESPELLKERLTATVFSGNMKPHKTELSMEDLMR